MWLGTRLPEMHEAYAHDIPPGAPIGAKFSAVGYSLLYRTCTKILRSAPRLARSRCVPGSPTWLPIGAMARAGGCFPLRTAVTPAPKAAKPCGRACLCQAATGCATPCVPFRGRIYPPCTLSEVVSRTNSEKLRFEEFPGLRMFEVPGILGSSGPPRDRLSCLEQGSNVCCIVSHASIVCRH